MQTLTTIKEIKAAVDAGKTVYSGTNAYRVIKDSIGQYLILCDLNNHCIMLHGRKGTQYENVLNGSTFYMLDDITANAEKELYKAINERGL